MGTQHQFNLHLLYNDARLASMLDTIDNLHTAASEGSLQKVTTLNQAEVVGWLNELLYTVQETLVEIERQSTDTPGVRLVK